MNAHKIKRLTTTSVASLQKKICHSTFVMLESPANKKIFPTKGMTYMNVSILENQTDVVKVNFVSTLQGKFNNAFASLSAKSFKIDKFTGNGLAFSDGVKIEVSHFESFKFNVTVQRVFDIFILKLSALLPHRKLKDDSDFKKFQSVSISLREFMTLCNIKNKTCAIEGSVNSFV